MYRILSTTTFVVDRRSREHCTLHAVCKYIDTKHAAVVTPIPFVAFRVALC